MLRANFVVAAEDVLGHRQLPEQEQFLMDHGHPGCSRITRRTEAHLRPASENLPSSRQVHFRQHLDQRGGCFEVDFKYAETFSPISA